MIVYLLIIFFFIVLSINFKENFTNYITINDKGDKIYKGLYKCNEYADLELN